jgi:hypothetical protein
MVPRNEATGKGARAGLQAPFVLPPHQDTAMDTDLTAVEAALADTSDTELHVLINATCSDYRRFGLTLLAWLSRSRPRRRVDPASGLPSAATPQALSPSR